MWFSVAIEVDAAHAAGLADALLEAGAISISVEDALAGTEHETPQFDEPGSQVAPLWERNRVIALFEPAPDLSARLATALAEAGIAPDAALTFEEVAEQDWVRLTQSQFDPIRISARLWIVPSWHVSPDPLAINLALDPGMAFGTGSHPTTRLCLEWLEQNVTPGCSVLDYGCGSGILAIAAQKLGAGAATGVDIDAAALTAAADNAQRNHVMLRLQHSSVPLEDRFDRVVANILTNPLMLLAPLLSSKLKPGGRIALSGVLESQSEPVIEAYAPFLTLRVGAVHEGWVRLEGER